MLLKDKKNKEKQNKMEGGDLRLVYLTLSIIQK